jgi:phosphohistidine phosphatase
VATDRRELVILRHAKSAWPDGVPDRRRPLTDRGRADAAAAGRWLREHVGRPGVVVCSPAERVRQTWELVAAGLDDPPPATVDDDLYGAPPDVLLAAVHALPDEVGTALLVGHNPGVQELVGLLCGEHAEMKTSSIGVLTWTGSWADAADGKALLEHHATPRG